METKLDSTLNVGYIASACSVSSFLAQVIKIAKTRDTATISVRMYTFTVIGFALWTTFGILRGEWPIILTNIICLCLSGFSTA
ncbi:SemiSWEET family transporter [Ochrobactrum vermis]|uniref:SemiSWEET family transporter n=1 Tax=Ochrobactrum vermis TaxID=1827297 RepID=A0ABU8PN10_9HYPH|nr:SemiSWEET family transporter [Ochrobactrum vermis]